MNLRLAWVVSASLLVVSGCTPESDPPPLFNARDLSVQCPTGQVGWDFSTGGNDSAIVENSVSREITVDSATLGTCNYKDDFAIDCDGKRDCSRLVKKPTSPACAGGAFRLVYRCGDETPRYELVVAGEASGQTVRLGCGEPITIVSAIYGSNAPTSANRADITTAVASACTGKRRCSLDDPYVLNSRVDPWPNAAKETAIRYYCGTDPGVKEATVASGARVDLLCPNVDGRVVQRDTMRFQQVSCPTCRPADQARLAQWEATLRARCEGRESCRIQLDKWVRGGPGPLLVKVDYWCTTPQAPESRLFYTDDTKETSLDLHCGVPIRIVAARGNAARLEAAREACDAKSTCVLPSIGFPASYDGGVPNPRQFIAEYDYTCGENEFDVKTTSYRRDAFFQQSTGSWRLSVEQPFDLQVRCPNPSQNLVGGIRIVDSSIGIVEATKQCYGRDVCNLPSNVTATYRCGTSNQVKSSQSASVTVIGRPSAGFPNGTPVSVPRSQLTCRPDVKILSLECDWDLDGQRDQRNWCWNAQRFPTARRLGADVNALCPPGNNGDCQLRKQGNLVAHLKWRCGADPKVYSYDGDGEPDPDYSYPVSVLRPRCEVADTPYVEKACVPATCPGTMRRDSKLACIPDATKPRTEVFTAPVLKEWATNPDGGTSQWGGAEVTALREDFPYQLFGFSQYRATNGARLEPTTPVTLWAYDEFTARADAGVPANRATTTGFRCVLAEAPIRDAEYPPITTGYRLVVNGGKGGVLPLPCFRQEVEDGRNAWSDAARRVGIPESEFRRKYTRAKSFVVSAFDPLGKTSARTLNGALLPAPNPIGFFYDSNNGWIDQLGFYSQSSDFRFRKEVTFVESNTIELSALSASLREPNVKLDVGNSDLLPTFDVDFTWAQRGDSPARNPFSPRTMLSANAATPLSARNLRATLELAYEAAVPGATSSEAKWVAVNAIAVTTTGLGGGNAMSQTARISGAFTPALRARAMSVRGGNAALNQTSDGFMRTWTEDKTLFRVRVCMDFDEVTHALGTVKATSASLDDKGVTASRNSVSYGLKFTRRCAEANPLLLERELFVYPTTPTKTQETPLNTAATRGQGDTSAGSGNDTGNQSACTEANGVQTCRGVSRNNMALSGQFPISAFESESNDEAAQEPTRKSTRISSEMKLFGFKVFDLSGGNGSEPQSAGAWEVRLDLTPNIQAIIDLVKSRKTAGVKTEGEKKKMKPKQKKGAVRNLLSKFERDGVGVALKKEFPFTLGPFPFVIEVGFTVGVGFGVTLIVGGDFQSVSSMANPKYGCLKATPGRCFSAFNDPQPFPDALGACRNKGGTLAEVRNAGDFGSVRDAVSMVGGATTAFWLGGQLAYQYEDPKCDTSRAATCPGLSRTRYAWLVGDAPFANQVGTATALVNPVALQGAHGFGTNLGTLTTRVPNDAAVLYKKDSQNLITDVASANRPYVCMFDPAHSYIESKIGLELKAEFSIGFSAKICTPSVDIGFCLGVGINLMTAGINIAAERSRVTVYDRPGSRFRLLGDSKISGAWEVAFLSGNFSAEMNFLFFSTSWEIASYKGLWAEENELFPELSSPYARTFP